MLFYLPPILNQLIGFAVASILITKLGPENTARLAQITSLSALIFPFLLLRLDVIHTHTVDKVLATSTLNLTRILLTLHLILCIILLTILMLSQSDTLRVIIVSYIGAIFYSLYCLSYAQKVRNRDTKGITELDYSMYSLE